jgi:hypothetical protein
MLGWNGPHFYQGRIDVKRNMRGKQKLKKLTVNSDVLLWTISTIFMISQIVVRYSREANK